MTKKSCKCKCPSKRRDREDDITKEWAKGKISTEEMQKKLKKIQLEREAEESERQWKISHPFG